MHKVLVKCPFFFLFFFFDSFIWTKFSHATLLSPLYFLCRESHAGVSGKNESVSSPPLKQIFFYLPAVKTCNFEVWLLTKDPPRLSNVEHISLTEQLNAFMLLEGRHVRGAHIVWLQRLDPVKDYHTQRNGSINSLLRVLEMTESMSAILGYIYLSHCYPTTKATGLVTQAKEQENKHIIERQREKGEGVGESAAVCFTARVWSHIVIQFKDSCQAIFSG